MRATDFDITPERRVMVAVLVLGEYRPLDSQERELLLDAMWDGWRELMRIKHIVEADYLRQKSKDNPQNDS